jgi:inosine/xanthosine triphosphate pyrophosphatase family protein
MIWTSPEELAYAYARSYWESTVSPLFSMDSGLEAFSLNPTHGSFSALTFQSTEIANYAYHRFLSY